MDEIIIYNMPISDDCPSGVCIDIPSGEVPIEDVLAKISPQATNVRVVKRDATPQDRYFRDAWMHAGERLDVDMTRAVAIHTKKLKQLRNDKLVALDGPYIQALERNDKSEQERIANLKQKLRDMPNDSVFLNAKTPEELKNTIPDYLK